MRVVVDTNIFVSAIMNRDGAPRQVLRECLGGRLVPLMSNALLAEYESVLARADLFAGRPIMMEEVEALFDAFASVCAWIQVYYLWRPNLRDEADNHLLELAVAGNAKAIVTANKKDFTRRQLVFPRIAIVNAGEFLHQLDNASWQR